MAQGRAAHLFIYFLTSVSFFQVCKCISDVLINDEDMMQMYLTPEPKKRSVSKFTLGSRLHANSQASLSGLYS
jgi:hypothetical protein